MNRSMEGIQPKSAIFYLTQNTDVRRTHLKTSLYFLFRNFNSVYKYPVIIFHEGDYTLTAQEDVILSIREACRSLVSFQTLDPGDFTVPAHIDEDRVRRVIALKPTPYWRNLKYRMMCRWWLMGFHKYAVNYEYVMRLDDDSIIEETINRDLFAWMKQTSAVYASNILHTDCALCCYGMKEFFAEECNGSPEKLKILEEAFTPSKIPMRAIQYHTFRSVLSINGKMPNPVPDELASWSPIMYYNNFFITKTAFWQQKEVQKIMKNIDEDGSIFYFRWGDAPLQTLIVSLFASQESIQRVIFKYSKRMQREAFMGDDGQLHSYMPRVYSMSSCITERE